MILELQDVTKITTDWQTIATTIGAVIAISSVIQGLAAAYIRVYMSNRLQEHEKSLKEFINGKYVEQKYFDMKFHTLEHRQNNLSTRQNLLERRQILQMAQQMAKAGEISLDTLRTMEAEDKGYD